MRFLLACLLLVAPLGALAQSGEYITNFNLLLHLDETGVLSVTEALQYDFGPASEKHGIIREIPYRYDTPLGAKTIDVDVVRVVDENEEPRPYEVTRSGGMVRIRIGDPDEYVSVREIYQIEYKVRDAVLFFDEYDEIYWNLTGSSWNVPMLSVSAVAQLDFREEGIREASCYQGSYGENTPCSFATTSPDGRDYRIVQQGLAPRSGVTVALSFSKGLVPEPRIEGRIMRFVYDNLIILLPVVVFLGMLRLWWVRGRDPKGRGVIVREYTPPEGLSAAEAGTVVDEWAEAKDITAQIVMLASRGYVKIHQFARKKLIFTESEYLLEKLKEPDQGLDPVSHELMEVLFDEAVLTTERIGEGVDVRGVLLSSMKHRFHETFQDLAKLLHEEVTRKGYFASNPRKVRAVWMGVGGGIAGIGFFLFPIAPALPPLWPIAIGLSGVVVLIVGAVMPRRTAKGVRAREHLLGLKEYIEQAEKERLEFHHNVEKVPAWFDTLLPYAMVLGVERSWARLFSEIYHHEPEWFVSHTGAAFSAEHLSTDLKGFTAAVAATGASASSGGSGSSGGGFSGGGFGGGGGGSW